MNGYDDEGVVEVFYQGAWGIIGKLGWKFDDVTSAHLCKTFGFGYSTFKRHTLCQLIMAKYFTTNRNRLE